MVCFSRSRPSFLQRARAAAVLVITLAGGGCASVPASEPGLSASGRSSSPARDPAQVGLHFWLPDGPAARVLSLQVQDLDEVEPPELAPRAPAERPRRASSLEREAGRQHARYVVLPGVDLAPAVEQKVAEIADVYFRRTGKELVVTSGTRDPARQAEAMHELFRHGADVLGLYRDKAAAREIKSAYEEAASADQPAEAVIEDLEQVIRAQIERGVFISAHLREGAVDIRNRDMTAAEKRAFIEGVEEVGGVLALEESRPPHYHLQVE
ncbi:hypothetical protein SOCE26_053560 [Sorangium cellulosum]|uniref:Secreted protein n=1 Tax=Sorangium cellulosum TaxID=56 RepID=A0A2L0EX71_SORCE|nr:hypothetical protein [Sorangium cellulosum]AUX43900.1 hypothetical protein SOCE26_053560 [Sorangium cellulosum]